MRRGLPHLQVEFRQDLVAAPEGAVRWAEALLAALQPALAELP
jgi:predicted N-formylglutamate amidohydrolase